ncbi:hypothetical protein [Actinomadura graeca]|uniref:hypothetical protein n=1 Tax=Actinomadura graeca TaxID=2750812 RepID=UPI001E4FA8D4|nr:hypothetical protein [Actinomadura graeca]
MTGFPALFAGLCDDAAVFPPGLAPLAAAVPAHHRHRRAVYGPLVGPFVLPATALDALGPLLTEKMDLAVTAPGGPVQVADALIAVSGLPVDLRWLEVAVPAGMSPGDFFRALDRARAGREDVPVYVEVPRDGRHRAIITMLAATGHRAKFRTGGVTADLHPTVAELAAAIKTAVVAGVPFKATAGLHNPVRHTARETGFDQHGYLNLILATEAALDGRPAGDLAGILDHRDALFVAACVSEIADRAEEIRTAFLSFGTCSISEPLGDLVGLGLLSHEFFEEGA